MEMPRYERPDSSVVADFGEPETAAVWGENDPIEDMSKDEARLQGYYPPSPATPRGRGYGGSESLLPVLGLKGEEASAKTDEYYRRKLAEGLIKRD